MKKLIDILFAAFAISAGSLILPGCNDNYEDISPGCYVNLQRIETFPGDTILISGQVSNGSPITSVSLDCEAWQIHHIYDRKGYKDNVFNYEYKLIVPQDAKFNQVLTIKAESENGHSTTREIPVSFLPDTFAPEIVSALNSQIGIDFDGLTGKAIWDLKIDIKDDRELKTAIVSIPSLSFLESFALEGKNASIAKSIELNATGSFSCDISIEDASGNKTLRSVEILAMIAETENPIQDYTGMYLVNASENPDDYIDGYYVWMDRQGEYQYQGKFYAYTDNFKLLFTPERNLDGDLYGVSPYVSSKLMNNNGYVVPATIEKAGYYGIWIDLQAHSFSVWPLETPENVYTGALRVSGTGFIFGDWGLPDEDMTRNGDYRYTYTTTLTEGYSGDCQYYFYSPDWSRIFRADVDGKWWFESASGPCIIFHTQYSGNVEVSFDTYLPWATIKKVR